MSQDKRIKNFKDLIKEVHDKGICQLCGGCVSFCSSADYRIIDFIKPDLPPQFVNEKECLECGICYHICPQTKVLENNLNIQYNYIKPLGNYKEIYSFQALDKDLLKNGTDGGVISAILLYLLEHNLIDGAIVSKKLGPFARDSMVAKSKNDLILAAGSHFDISSQVTEIANFSTYSPTIMALNRYKFKKLAVIGTPCQIYTIRCMQEMGVTPSQNIKYLLGLFCYGNFTMGKDKKEKFETQFNLKIEEIEKLNIKEDMLIKLKGSEVIQHISFSELSDYIRSACNACNDFTNIYADISFGGLSSPEKYTTTIPRTKLGINIVKSALNEGYIKVLSDLEGKRDKMLEKLIQFSKYKEDRYNLSQKNLGVKF